MIAWNEARSRLSCGVSTASGSTFLCSPSKAVASLGTLFVARDLSDVLLVDAEERGGSEGRKDNVGGGGGGEDSGGDEGRDDGGAGEAVAEPPTYG